MEIEKYDASIKVIQSKYDENLLLKLKMAECKKSKCPSLSRVKLDDFGSAPLVDIPLYRQLVGSLLYLTHSWTDLEYYAGVVSRYM